MAATRDYIVRMPRDTTVVAACHEVRCEAWQSGWETLVDEGTPLGQARADYIRHLSGRTFTEHRAEGGRMTVFRFEPRQRCFAEHRTRPAVWRVAGVQVATAGDWFGDLGEHMDRLETQLRKG